MVTIYETSVDVGREGSAPGLLGVVAAAYDELDSISRSETGVALGVRDRLAEEFAVLPGGWGGPRIGCVHREVDDRKAVALRYQGSPSTGGLPEREIDVVVSAGAREEGATCRVSIRVRHRHPETPGVTPALVGKLAREFGISLGGREVPIEVETVNEQGVRSRLLPALLDADRALPFVVVSPIVLNGRPYADAASLQRALEGMAVVVVIGSVQATFPVAKTLGTNFACYQGAVRIYYPGFRTSDPPGAHPLWTPAEQSELADFPRAVSTRIARWRAEEFGRSAADWLLLTETRSSYEDEESGVVALDREQRLQGRIRDLEGELERERRRTASLEERILELESRLDELEPEPRSPRPPVDDDEGAAAVIREEVERSDGRLTLALNARSDLSGYPFEDLDALRAAVEWLRTTYWEARLGDHPRADLPESLRVAAPGFWYRPHQSDSTKGRYPEDYRTRWEGRGYPLDAHLGHGSSRDPRRSIRIAFAVDESRGTVVIGYVGQHQRTTAT